MYSCVRFRRADALLYQCKARRWANDTKFGRVDAMLRWRSVLEQEVRCKWDWQKKA